MNSIEENIGNMSKRVIKKLITPFEKVRPDAAILIVNLFDPQINTVTVFKEAVEEKGLPYFIVGNKLDIVKDFIDLHEFFNVEIVYSSMLTGKGLEKIRELIKENFKPSSRIIVLGIFNSGKTSLISRLTGLELKIKDLPGTTMEFRGYPYDSYTLIDSIGWLSDINKPLMISIDLSGCNLIEEKIERIFKEEIRGLKETSKIALFRIKEVVNVLKNAVDSGNKLITVGAGASGLIAMQLASQALETGVPAMVFTNNLVHAQPVSFAKGTGEEEAGLSKYTAQAINPGDVVVGISVSGGTGFVYHALKLTKEKGAITIAITENPDTPLGKFADYVIRSNAKPEGPSASKTMVAHMVIAHAIVLTLADERGISADESVKYMIQERVETKRGGVK
jgi:D-arabinose 5-phosphate isomerase GutQ/GTP-binding protein EngB required for normal cell division